MPLFHFKSVGLMGLPALVGLGVVGCQQSPTAMSQTFALVNPAPIVAIQTIRSSSVGSSVAIAGEVISMAPLVGQSAYEVKDETGTIWVVTAETVPTQGTRVEVHGIVRTLQGDTYLQQQSIEAGA
jgi:RecJ-like exonuclease